MSAPDLADLIDHMIGAASDARDFIDGLSKDDFLADRRTQNAVVMCLIVVGEAATKILDRYPSFAARNSNIPWRSMRGMRNRIAHGYFDINFEIVWDTVNTAISDLLSQLPGVIRDVDNV